MTMTRTQFKRQPAKEPKPKPGPRQRKCKCCGASFVPFGIQSWCGPECGYKLSQVAVAKKKAKEQRQERAATKAKLKTRADWLREAQAVFNAYVRERDHDQPCISCGRFHKGSYDAGHYRSVGAQPALRFNETNVHKQCVPCNQHKGGNIVEYRIRLIDKIGRVSVEWLESEHAPLKLDIPSIQAIKVEYSARLRELKGKL